MIASVIRTDNCYVISSPVLHAELSGDSFQITPDNRSNHDSRDAGRAPVSFITLGEERAVLRHYYRGGLIARISNDKFVWTGIHRTRSLVEYRLLQWMTDKQLPVPQPLGARVLSHGAFYSCDLITREVPFTLTFAKKLQLGDVSNAEWGAIGYAIKQLHDHGIWHADLNANNILLNNTGVATLIDFDRCRLRTGTGWKQGNIERLKRSLNKLKKLGVVNHFNASDWRTLLNSYQG